jgi:3-methyladenine DNA glycosylase AlkD
MTLDETMARLSALGSAKTKATYQRHGAGENTFGVSFAEIGKLQKTIKQDQALAEGLWDTGNYDARNLAILIADPKAFTPKKLDAWVHDCNNHGHAELVARYIASKTEFAPKSAEKWRASKKDLVSELGWSTLAGLKDAPDSYYQARLKEIEAGIHHAPNRTRHAMNMALIAIGLRNAALEKLAIAAAKRIGKVEVDHGDTACKTPDAVAYIEKAKKHLNAKKTATKNTKAKKAAAR